MTVLPRRLWKTNPVPTRRIQMWRRALSCSLAIAGLLLSASGGPAQVSSNASKGQNGLRYRASAGPALTLISPGAADFEKELAANFPDYATSKYHHAAAPYLVILKNTTPKTVRAYEVWWTTGSSSASSQSLEETLKATSIVTPLEIREPLGFTRRDDTSVCPGEERLITPWFSGRTTKVRFFGPVPQAVLVAPALFIARDAQHDEALTIARKLHASPRYSSLSKELEQRTNIGGSNYFITQPAMATYMRARANAAQEFRTLLERGGYKQVQFTAEQLIAVMPPHAQFTTLGGRYHLSKFMVNGSMVEPLD